MGHGRDFSNMSRRTAWLMLLPLVLLSFMTPKVRSQSRNGKQAKTAGSKSVMKPSASQQVAKVAKALTEAPDKWVESTLKEMSVEEKVGQLLFATYHGSFTPTDATAYAQMMHDVEDLHVGGFINVTQGSSLGFLKSQAYPSAVLSNQLQAKSKLPLLIGASARGRDPVDLRAGRGREQQSRKPDHQYAFVWRKPGEGFRIRRRIYPWRAGKRRLGHRETFSRARRHDC